MWSTITLFFKELFGPIQIKVITGAFFVILVFSDISCYNIGYNRGFRSGYFYGKREKVENNEMITPWHEYAQPYEETEK